MSRPLVNTGLFRPRRLREQPHWRTRDRTYIDLSHFAARDLTGFNWVWRGAAGNVHINGQEHAGNGLFLQYSAAASDTMRKGQLCVFIRRLASSGWAANHQFLVLSANIGAVWFSNLEWFTWNTAASDGAVNTALIHNSEFSTPYGGLVSPGGLQRIAGRWNCSTASASGECFWDGATFGTSLPAYGIFPWDTGVLRYAGLYNVTMTGAYPLWIASWSDDTLRNDLHVELQRDPWQLLLYDEPRIISLPLSGSVPTSYARGRAGRAQQHLLIR